MQLHHFGAFYKRSWRANDWMWGRIDGAGWLVHVLLDPRRLALLAAKKRVGERRAFLLAELTAIVGAAPEDGEKPGQAGDINNELGYLDKPDTDLPNALPSTALWVASALQRLIAQEELPQLADEILGAGKPADWSPPASRRWAKRVKAAALADVPATLASCEVQKETLAGDLGSPLMARTMSKAVATAIGAVVSVKRLPAGVRSLLGSVRTMTVGGYRVVRAAHGVAQRTILAGLAMLAVGIVLAAQSTAVLGVTGMSLAAVGGYLVVFATWQLSGRLFGAIVGFTITAAIASLTIRSERRWLFGTTPTKAGWVGRHVHWLGGAWWRPLLPVLAIAIVFALESVVLSALRRWSLGRLHLGSRHASPPDSQG
jgi:hypothetical protein